MKQVCMLTPKQKMSSEPVPPPTEMVVWLLHENSFRKCKWISFALREKKS